MALQLASGCRRKQGTAARLVEPLEQLRSTLCVVPQDPVLFGESVRFNLDPFKLYADGAIWEALRAVQL